MIYKHKDYLHHTITYAHAYTYEIRVSNNKLLLRAITTRQIDQVQILTYPTVIYRYISTSIQHSSILDGVIQRRFRRLHRTQFAAARVARVTSKEHGAPSLLAWRFHHVTCEIRRRQQRLLPENKTKWSIKRANGLIAQLVSKDPPHLIEVTAISLRYIK